MAAVMEGLLMVEAAMEHQSLLMIMLLLPTTLTRPARPSPMDHPMVVAQVEDMQATPLLHMMVDIKYLSMVSYQWCRADKKSTPLLQASKLSSHHKHLPSNLTVPGG